MKSKLLLPPIYKLDSLRFNDDSRLVPPVHITMAFWDASEVCLLTATVDDRLTFMAEVDDVSFNTEISCIVYTIFCVMSDGEYGSSRYTHVCKRGLFLGSSDSESHPAIVASGKVWKPFTTLPPFGRIPGVSFPQFIA